MSEGYTKLFSTIATSTIWSEPLATRVVWITMLATADRCGEVQASVPGLARLANVSMDECVAALATFLAPDPYSRTPDNEGRRIEVVDGGWRLLNHSKYRAKLDADDRRERKAKWMAESRAKAKKSTDGGNVHSGQKSPQESTSGQSGHITDASTDAPTNKEEKIGASPVGDAPPAEPKSKKPKREKRPELTLDQWLATIPDDADIVPADDPLWSWWDTQRLPFEWRPLAWAAFEQKYHGKPKRYADWLAVFRSAVREDWLKVWRILPDGSTVLTTVGEQLRRAA